jgi:hypothetical protein
VLALLAMISIPIANSSLHWHSRAPLYAETILLVVAIAAVVWTYRQQGS